MKKTELEKKFSDKKFLKTNEFVVLVGRFLKSVQNNRPLVLGLVAVALVLILGIPGYKYYQKQQFKKVNEMLYEAKNSLKKEALYQQIIDEYGALELAHVARVRLADYYIENNQKEKAFDVLNVDFGSSKPSLLGTLVVFKRVGLLKADGQFEEAQKYLQANQKVVLPELQPKAKLYQARLLWLDKKQDQAKSILDQVKVELETKIDSAKSETVQNKNLAENRQLLKEVKEQLLYIELGLM